MARSLSLDLREHVVAAVSGGMSRRQAAEWFGVCVASAIRWCARDSQAGSSAAKPRGGDRHSARIEAQSEQMLALVDERDDITLAELQAHLAERGHRFGIGTLWRFFARHGECLNFCVRGGLSWPAPIEWSGFNLGSGLTTSS